MKLLVDTFTITTVQEYTKKHVRFFCKLWGFSLTKHLHVSASVYLTAPYTLYQLYSLPTYLAQFMKHFISLLAVHIFVFTYFVETLVCRHKKYLTWSDNSLIISIINPNNHSICWILISQGTGEHFFVYQKHNFLHKFWSKAHK